MPDRRFEDKLSMEEMMKKPAKVVRAMTYMQVVKTNGTVTRHENEIGDLQKDIKDKIGIAELNRMQKIFAWITGSIAFILIVFNIIDRIIRYTGG